MKKRVISIVLTLIMLMSIVPVTAMADSLPAFQLEVTAKNGSISHLKANDEVTVEVKSPTSVMNAFSHGTFKVSFDKERLVLTKRSQDGVKTAYCATFTEDTDAEMFGCTMTTVKKANENGEVVFAFTNKNTSGYDIPANTVFMALTFKVKSDAPVGVVKVSGIIDSIYGYPSGNKENITAKYTAPGDNTEGVIVSALTGELPVTITAPVKGAAPQTTITGTNYTGSITWDPTVSGTFAASTVYTAKVTLKANTGYQFANGVNPTVKGATISGTSVSPDGKTLTFDAKFPATNAKDTPTITTAPAASAITYGQKLSDSNLTGGVASVNGTNVEGKFTWKDGNTAPQVKNSNSTGYEVVFTPTDTANYAPTTCKVMLAVNPKSLSSISIIPIDSQPYTGLEIKPDVTVKDGQPPYDTLAESDYSVAYSNNKDVGTADIVISPKVGGNYSFAAGTFHFTIEPASSSIYITSDPSKTYDGSAVTDPTVSKTGSGGAVTYKYYTNADCTTETTSAKNGAASDGAAPKNAGDYWVKATVAGSTNYSAATSSAKKFTISQRNISEVTVATIADKEYTGSPIKPTPAVTYNGETLASGTDYTVEYTSNLNVGTATATIKAKTGGNFIGTVEKKFTITKKVVSISTASVANKAFDSTVNIPDGTVTASLSETGLTQGTHYTVSATTTQQYVGTGTATVTVKLTDAAYKNYTFASGAQSATKTANITVTPVTTAIAATQTEISVAKGGNTLDLKDYITMSAGYSAKDKLTFSQSGTMPTGTSFDANTGVVTSGSESSTTAFTVKVKCSAVNMGGDATDEYAESNELTFNIKVVDKKDAKVTITGTAPTQVAYGGNGFTLSAKAADMGTGTGKWTWTSSNDAVLKVDNNGKVTIAGVGTAKITAQYESNTTIGSATTADIEVTPRGIADAKVTVTGTYTYTGSEIKPDASKVTVKIGEKTLSEGTDFTLEYAYNTDASTKAQVKIVGKGNYQGNAFATFTIARKALTDGMIAAIAAQTYDGAPKTPVLTVTDSGKNLVLDTDYTAKYTNNINAGTATVTITGKGNYTGTAKANFTINKKEVALPTDSTTAFTYTGATQTYQPTGFDAAAMTISGNTAVNAGTVTVIVRLKDTKNCKWAGGAADPTFSFTINKKALADSMIGTIAAQTYNGTSIKPAVTVTDGTAMKASDYTVTYGENKNVSTGGTVTVTATSGGNYTGTANGTFTINPRSLSFTATVANKIYDGNGKATATPGSFALRGVVGTDDVTVDETNITAAFQDNSGKFDAGRYSVKVSGAALIGADAANYVLSSTEISVSNVEILKLTDDILPGGTTLKKGDAAKADAETAVGTLSTAAQEALKINDLADNEKKLEAVKKAMAGKAGQSETNSQLLMLSGTGELTLAYPDKVTSRFALKVTHLKSDGTIEVLTGVEAMAAGLKLTASEAGLYLLSWKAPSSGGSGGGGSYGSGAHTFTTDLTGINLVKVDGKVVPSKYYTISGSDVTLSAEFMSTLSNGKHTIAIENATKVARATFTVSSNDKATYQPTSKEPTQAPGEIVKVTVDSGKATVTAVYVDGVKLSGKDYVLSGKTVKLQGTYTQKLSVGYHTLQVDYSNGATATARFEIKGAVVSPKTGDASVYLYAAMALMSGTGAAYVTLRRKKEN